MSDLQWTNCTVRLSDLRPWADNPRCSSKAQAKRLLKSFEKFGQVQTIGIGPQNEVYDGHQRLSALLTIHGGEYEVDARRSNRPLTDDERRELVAALHLGAFGSWDWDKLSTWDAPVLQEWGGDKDTLKGWKSDVNNLNEFINANESEPVDAEPQIDRAEELQAKWQVQTGDLWQIGEHRLLCGDSTKREDVERVMGGEKATLVFTDPPYSFETDGGWFNGKCPAVMDSIKESGINIFDPLPFLTTLGAVFNTDYHSSFIFCNKALVHRYLNYAVENGFSYNILVWKKSNVVPFGDSHFPDVEYLIFIRKGAKWNNGTDANRSKVLIYDLDFVMQENHPTPKPILLIENELLLTTGVDDVVYDGFCGSGTTIAACQNLNRKCRAIEIAPKYCAVTLERMSQAFPDLEIKRL